MKDIITKRSIALLLLFLLPTILMVQPAIAANLPQTTATPPASTAVPAYFDVEGVVSSPSMGSVPAGLKAKLQGYDGMGGAPALELETDVDADGRFSFKNVELLETRVYVALVNYQELVFSSNVIHSADVVAGDPVQASIVIYESTTDTSALSADRVHVFFDFTQPGFLDVVEMYVISNADDLMARPEEGQPLFTFNLPAGATGLRVEDGGRTGLFTNTDTSLSYMGPVYPGTPPTQILFGYSLPYGGNKAAVNWTPVLPVTSVIFGVPQDGVTLTASGLQDDGVRDMQGMPYQLFSAANLPAGQPLTLDISGVPAGSPAAAPNAPAAGMSSNDWLILILAGAGILLVLAGTLLYVKRRNAPEAEAPATPGADDPAIVYEPESEDELLDAIVALDDLNQAGKLEPVDYLERREALKERLRLKRQQ